MPDGPINPKTPRHPPATPLFAATIAFSAGIVLQSYCYKPAALYFICTIALALCSLLALRAAARGHRTTLVYCGAALFFGRSSDYGRTPVAAGAGSDRIALRESFCSG
jgi:hypothetical protein